MYAGRAYECWWAAWRPPKSAWGAFVRPEYQHQKKLIQKYFAFYVKSNKNMKNIFIKP